jgi:hypothetical protein
LGSLKNLENLIVKKKKRGNGRNFFTKNKA